MREAGCGVAKDDHPTCAGQWDQVKACTPELQAFEERTINAVTVGTSNWWPQRGNLGMGCNTTQFSLFNPMSNALIRSTVRVRSREENYLFWCMPQVCS
jgi:hypothetical protein